MTAQRTTFLIPELRVSANDAQLKRLQHNLLNDYYKRQMVEKQQKYGMSNSTIHKRTFSESKLPNFSSTNNIESNYSYAYFPQYNPEEDLMKKQLIKNYQQQLEYKQSLKKQALQKQRMESEQVYDAVKAVAQTDRIRAQIAANKIKTEAFQQIREQELKKKLQKQKVEEQKKAFHDRYAANMMGLEKERSFKQHFHNVEHVQDINGLAYLSTVAPLNKKIQREKEKIVENGINQSQKRLRQSLQLQARNQKRYRDQLRDTLVKQIQMNEEKRKKDWAYDRSIGYTTQSYHGVHHPINNPVDFKVTHDNKYIIGQLRSGLARSGSQSLV